jgi:Chalcone isomerase-like
MACCLLLSWNASALDLADVHLADTMKVGDEALQLNGGGIRTKWFFKIYVGALYLPQKQTSAEAVIADEHEHRIVMHMLHGLGSKRLFNAFNEGIEANNTPEELAKLDAQIKQMKQIFDSVNEVKPGDVIMLDYLPASGTRITVNGTARGDIPGAAFNRALIKVWLGDRPVQDDLKKGMLGG